MWQRRIRNERGLGGCERRGEVVSCVCDALLETLLLNDGNGITN